MIPILLLSTTIFLSLTLLRTHLSHNLTLSESATKITELETQLARMRQQQRRARERERKERERILPIVVERVLQKVGAMSEELQEEEEPEPRLLV
jgi:DNA-binding protein H-NS